MMDLLNKLKVDNKKIILIVLAFATLIYLDYSFVIGMQLKNINNTQPKIVKLKNDLGSLKKDLSRIDGLKNKHIETSQKILSKVKKLVPESQTVSLLQNISETAKKDGIQVVQIRSSKEFDPKQEKLVSDKLSPLTITLDLSSDYHRFGKFINDLEDLETFVAIQSFKINSQQADYIKQRISLVLKTYVSK